MTSTSTSFVATDESELITPFAGSGQEFPIELTVRRPGPSTETRSLAVASLLLSLLQLAPGNHKIEASATSTRAEYREFSSVGLHGMWASTDRVGLSSSEAYAIVLRAKNKADRLRNELYDRDSVRNAFEDESNDL